MPRTREEFHEKLCEVLGSRHVYFEPPASVKMTYPAIVYSRAAADVLHADNKIYRYVPCYDVTTISKNPEFNLFWDFKEKFTYCREGRDYDADNLKHKTYTIYY